MSRTVVVGLDGSAESLAATEWAAREARLRGLPLKLVHALEDWSPAYAYVPPVGGVVAPTAYAPRYWAERIPREVSERLCDRHPDLEIRTEEVNGRPIEVLEAAAKDAEVLVLGSQGLSVLAGFVIGSVSMSVLAHAERPVVLVRAGEQAGDEYVRPGVYRDVVLGLDLARPCDEVIEYAFDAAQARGAGLRVVHGWSLPPVLGYDPAAIDPGHAAELETRESAALSAALRPWRDRFPGVRVEEQCVVGRAADHLAEASADASLLVIGRRIRRAAFGAHIGPVAHAVLHHTTAPVAVVPHP
ncbi:universal stress protein [Streptomyces vilmorinianum]|uniref:universal stress protein n=1 Tax=Streptomyces vilmorinianum TaxID=3051092 RepID=UPI0010FB63E6|nr:universal stress protein [Streptomyces vilmorinianum]